MAPSSSSLGISWVLSSVSGYGIYGLQIALQFLRRGGSNLLLTRSPSVCSLPPLAELQVTPFFELAHKLELYTKKNPEELLAFDYAFLHGCSNDFSGFPGQDKIWGSPNVACAAIEQLYTTPHGMNISKNYQMFIAISRWNADYLRSLNVGPVHLCHQGIDPVLFHPGPRYGFYPNRFLIFSGGKFEFRKGQDIVLEAYKRFRVRHSDALLVAVWQNLTMPDAEAFHKIGYCEGMPAAAQPHGLSLTPWLLRQGLPPGSFIDVPLIHNQLTPSVLRECDVAIFPNRCEGGTNLVAMEAIASAVPTYVSYNTGHKDLVDLIGCDAFRTQRSVEPSSSMTSAVDWGETDVDEVVEALEYVYTHRAEAQQKATRLAAKMKDWEWGPLNEKLLNIVCDGKGDT